MTRRIHVVAGMHRAGTSVVASGLKALGVDLGDHLMSADLKVNARGFFEDVDVVALDDALLDAHGADWKSSALLEDADWRAPQYADMRADARRLLEQRLASTGQFGFKDPRVPRLLPFWQAVFADMHVDETYVIAVRHPQSVIDSLTARDQLDVRRSCMLWLSHLLLALRYTAGRRRIVVDYDRLLAAPEHELARMARGLGLPAPARADPGVRTYLDEFLSPHLRHSEHARDDTRNLPWQPLVARAHALAQRMAASTVGADEYADTMEIDALNAELAVHAPLLAYAGTIERAADALPYVKLDLEWVRNETAQGKVFVADLQSALQRKEEDAQAAAAAQAAAKAFNDDLRAALRRKDDELTGAQRAASEAQGVAQTYIEDLLATLRRKEGELVAAHGALDRIRERLVGRMLMKQIDKKR